VLNKVLNEAKKQTSKMVEKLWKFHQNILKGERGKFLKILTMYIDALSVEIEEEGGKKKIFLLSHPHKALGEYISNFKLELSPYRGVYYGWKLAEIYHSFGEDKLVLIPVQKNQREEKVKKELQLLYEKVKSDFCFQKNSKEYGKYKKLLECQDKSSSLMKEHIKGVKRILKKILIVENKFIHSLLYPARTSTHFYLSGIGFYWYPVFLSPPDTPFDSCYYYVHSTDSGIFNLREHFGTLRAINEVDEWEELLEKIPPGSLALDLETDEVSDSDVKNVKYFEEWSRCLTEDTYKILSETLDRIEKDWGEGQAYFRSKLKKNPLRKFYFDTGIYKIAELAGEKKAPRISYLTTIKSFEVPDLEKKSERKKYLELSTRLWEKFMDTGGIDYFLLKGRDWDTHKETAELSKLTLIASEALAPVSGMVLSFRDKEAKKISHGMSSWQVLLKVGTEGIKKKGKKIAKDIMFANLLEHIPLELFSNQIKEFEELLKELEKLGEFKELEERVQVLASWVHGLICFSLGKTSYKLVKEVHSLVKEVHSSGKKELIKIPEKAREEKFSIKIDRKTLEEKWKEYL